MLDKDIHKVGSKKATIKSKVKSRTRISPITRRILAINILALVSLAIGLLYVGKYRQGLIESEIASLKTQVELFATALGESAVSTDNASPTLVLSEVQQIVRRMVAITETSAKIFHPDGRLIIDSQSLASRGPLVEIKDLPPPRMDNAILRKLSNRFSGFFWSIFGEKEQKSDLLVIKRAALNGEQGVTINILTDGRLELTVATPVQRYKRVLAALLLTRSSHNIDQAVFQIRLDILKVFFVVLLVTILVSIYLASSIASPLRRLALLTEGIRKGEANSYKPSNILDRKDEIGELGNMLNDMTEALWLRMEAIESFASDVAHEIKNPITSLKSAVETVNSINNHEQKQKLMEIILNDIERLDRLITDISDASRLDTELSRAKMVSFDIYKLLKTLVASYDSNREVKRMRFELITEVDGTALIQGIEDRLGQVFRNVISNAISFSPNRGLIRIRVIRQNKEIVVSVEDEGPGLQPGTEIDIFNRFYRERPQNEKFGLHSGLGLSISQQIVQVHGGSIRAENVQDNNGEVLGACFVINLPEPQ